MPTTDRQDWRRIFIDTIMELAGGKADVLQIADWAIEAQQSHGQRDPTEVAHEEFTNANPASPV